MEERIREGFPKQRLVVAPANVLRRCRKLPVVSQLYVTDIGSYPSAPHHYVERPRGAAQAILIYCVDGAGELDIAGQQHAVRQGTAVVIPPHAPHVYRSEDSDPWSLLWVHFTGHQTAAVLQSLGVSADNPLLHVPDTLQVRNAFEDTFACLNHHDSDAGLLAMSSELLRLLGKIKLHQSPARPQRQSAENRVGATLDFMRQHVDKLLTLEQLAALSGQSASYYCKLFKERTGQTPLAYFSQLKVRRACELLDLTDLTVRQIAAELGYEDPYYFSRLFKKVQGCSPAKYRAAVKG